MLTAKTASAIITLDVRLVVKERVGTKMAEELIEVLDENGISAGKAVSRRAIHEKGLWHRGVIIAVLNDKRQVLMQQRSLIKDKYPGKWDLSVAGHIPYGEDSISTAIREMNEEINYALSEEISVRDFRYLTSFRKQEVISEDLIENQFYDFLVLNRNMAIDDLNMQESEVLNLKYISIAELLKMKQENLLHPRTEWIDVLVKYLRWHS